MNAQGFWKRVNELIKQNGLKQESVCNACDINYQTFRGWIVRSAFPYAFQAFRIAQYLNTSVEFLITGKENNHLAEENKRLQEKIKSIADIVNNK